MLLEVVLNETWWERINLSNICKHWTKYGKHHVKWPFHRLVNILLRLKLSRIISPFCVSRHLRQNSCISTMGEGLEILEIER